MAKKEVKIIIHARDEASRKIKGVAGTLKSAFKSALLPVAAGGGAVLAFTTKLGIEAVKLAASFEQTKVAFTTMLGSSTVANQFLAKLQQFSAKTPFEPEEIFATSKQLLSFGFNIGQVTRLLTVIGNVSAGTGKDIQELGRIMGKIFTKGKAQGEELNQMAEAGIPIIRELGKLYGVTGKEVFEMGSKGQISFNDINQALTNMTTEGGTFFGMMEKQSQTLNGQLSTMVGNLKQIGIELGTSLLPILKDITAQTNKFMTVYSAIKNTKLTDLNPFKAPGLFNMFSEGGPVLAPLKRIASQLAVDELFKKPMVKILQGVFGTNNIDSNKAQGGLNGAERAKMQKEQKLSTRIKARIDQLKEQVRLQKLINSGKEREAFIEQQLNAAGKIRKLTEEEKAKLTREAGSLYDLRNSPKSDGITQPPAAPEQKGALQAFVLRGLSGLTSDTEEKKAAEQTKKNTANTVNAINQSNQYLNEMLKRMAQRGAYNTASITG